MGQSWNIAVLWALFVSMPLVNAGLDSCISQAGCLTSTLTLVSDGVNGCTNAPCQYQFCLTLQAGGTNKCPSSISHTCAKSDTACTPDNEASFGNVSTVKAVNASIAICQYGAGGSTLYFLLKDANQCSDPNTYKIGDTNMACEPRPDSISSCTGNAAGMECIWSVTLPSCPNPSPSSKAFQPAEIPATVVSPSPAQGDVPADVVSPSQGNQPTVVPSPGDNQPAVGQSPGSTSGQCDYLESIWSNFVHFESHGGCSIDFALGYLSHYKCVRQAGCNFIKCDTVPPASAFADLRKLGC